MDRQIDTDLGRVEDEGLQHILKDPIESGLFKRFLDEERSSEHLLFWIEAEVYRTTEMEANELFRRAKAIFEKYVIAESKYEINVNSTILSHIRKRMAAIEKRREEDAAGAKKRTIRLAIKSKANETTTTSLSSSMPVLIGSSSLGNSSALAVDKIEESTSFGSLPSGFIPATLSKSPSADSGWQGIQTSGSRDDFEDDDDYCRIDNNIFTAAQNSVFSLLEMDSFPRFLNSEIYINYSEGRREKEQADDDLTYLIHRLQHPDTGVAKLMTSDKLTSSYSQLPSVKYSESFVATDLVTWMMQTLYLSDRRASVRLCQRLAEKSIIICTYHPTSSSSYYPMASSSSGSVLTDKFEDDNALWRLQKKPTIAIGSVSLKSIPQLFEALPAKSCERSSFHIITSFTNFLINCPPILNKVISSSWAISRSDRDIFANSLVKVAYDANVATVAMIKSILEKSFQQKDLGSLKYGDNSLIIKMMNYYFGLIGREWIRAALIPLFKRSSFENELCFDLRSDREDQSINQIEFVKITRLVLDNLFTNEMLMKIPSDVREIAHTLGELCMQNAPEKFVPLVGGLLLRALSRALLRPDLYDIVPSPFIPLPKVKENLWLLSRCMEALITGSKFSIRAYNFMSFMNTFLDEKRHVMIDFLNKFVTEDPKANKICVGVVVNFSDYSNVVRILKNNEDKLQELFQKHLESSEPLLLGRHKTETTPENYKTLCKQFFQLLKDASTLLMKGQEKLKIYYCPVFPSSKIVISFCLANSIAFEGVKIDYLRGDFKEDPILVDNEVNIVGSENIVRYLADKYCVSANFFGQTLRNEDKVFSEQPNKREPNFQLESSGLNTFDDMDTHAFQGTPEEYRKKMREYIEKYLFFCEHFIKKPIRGLFWRETFPRFNAHRIVKKKALQEKEEDIPSISTIGYEERMDRLAVDSFYEQLSESLTLLDNILSKKQKQGKKFLTSRDQISIADLSIAEELTMISLFHWESLECYPCIKRWFDHVTEELTWKDINQDYENFVQYVNTVTENEGVPSIEYSLGLVKWTPRQVYDSALQLAKDIKKVKVKDNRGSIATMEEVPERVIVLNFKSEYIPVNHYSALEFVIIGISGATNIPVTKLRCNIINVPPNKQKPMNEECNKIWKQMNAITLSDWTTKLYWHTSPADVWETLFSVEKISAATKSKATISSKPGTGFTFLDGHVMGSNVALYTNEMCVQKWRMSDWPVEHYSTVKYKLSPYLINGIEIGTFVEYTHINIPTDKLKEVRKIQKKFWKKLRAELVDNLIQDVYFMDTTPAQLYENFQKNEHMVFPNFQLIPCTQNVPNSQLTRAFRGSDWPLGQQSKITITLYQGGDRDVRYKKYTKLVLLQENVPKAKVKSITELWEKHFWKKMKGVITTDVHQSIMFNLVTPSVVYENLLNFGKFTNKKCEVSEEVGVTYSLYDNSVNAQNLKLVKDQLIIMKWRFSDWPEEHFGTVRFVLKPIHQLKEEEEGEEKPPKMVETTKVLFSHEAIPVGKSYDHAVNFWDKFWKTIKGPKGEIAAGIGSNKLSKKATLLPKI